MQNMCNIIQDCWYELRALNTTHDEEDDVQERKRESESVHSFMMRVEMIELIDWMIEKLKTHLTTQELN